ncbi:carboxypeptidase-like regulatory domain-containing protein [Psychroflexus tropicus]|uniref:carboxypeptidase-like regulatory domain-containing protein n=1 Tax=Psychroflexus tropicus TaxID=197345 RepID=UPI00035F0B24|nr:carboxypeptidase-like regulatory domain-containing protein [Psychroflexus tropicus]
MKNIVFLIVSILFISCGQDSNLLDGKVTNAEGKPIDNVLVQVMGTDLNSKTDGDGYYRINTKERGDELIFTHPQYKMMRIQVGDQTEISVELTEKKDLKPKK